MTDVYRNLTRRGWSIRERGRVVGHLQFLTLAGAVMIVRPGARARVLRTGHREVQAWIRGDLIPHAGVPPVAVRLRYRPFEAGHFTDDCGLQVQAAAFVFLDEDGRAWHSETGTPARGST